MKQRRRTGLIVASVLMLVLVAVGGSLAWLTDETAKVTNTFTVGDVDIDLAETKGNTFQLIPGNTYEKDPTVSVDAGSEDCYLFIQVEKTNNPDSYLTYTSALDAAESGWTKLEGHNDVYFRTVLKTDTARSWELIKDNSVRVKTEVGSTVSMPADTALPTLSYTAFAIQKANVGTAAAAWSLLNP